MSLEYFHYKPSQEWCDPCPKTRKDEDIVIDWPCHSRRSLQLPVAAVSWCPPSYRRPGASRRPTTRPRWARESRLSPGQSKLTLVTLIIMPSSQSMGPESCLYWNGALVLPAWFCCSLPRRSWRKDPRDRSCRVLWEIWPGRCELAVGKTETCPV